MAVPILVPNGGQIAVMIGKHFFADVWQVGRAADRFWTPSQSLQRV